MLRKDTLITAAVAALFVLTVQFAMQAVVRADNTSTPTKVNTFSPGNLIRASELNTDFDDLYTGLRNIGTANLLDGCITTTKLVDANVTIGKLETAAQAALAPSGTVLDYIAVTAPTGWVLASGRTIGDASSGGTERANADTSVLFALLWNGMADAQAAVSTGRGGSATADFAAHKTITLPDLRGRVVAGKDDMGGSTASRLTNGGSGITATTNGIAGGAETHTLSTAEMPAHNHTATSTDSGHNHTQNAHLHNITDVQHSHTYNTGHAAVASAPGALNVQRSDSFDASTTTSNFSGINTTLNSTATNNVGNAIIATTVNNTGGGGAHTVTQPTYVLSKIIKLCVPLNYLGGGF